MPRQIGIEKPIRSIAHNYISIKLSTASPMPKPITSPPLLWAPELHHAAGTATHVVYGAQSWVTTKKTSQN